MSEAMRAALGVARDTILGQEEALRRLLEEGVAYATVLKTGHDKRPIDSSVFVPHTQVEIRRGANFRAGWIGTVKQFDSSDGLVLVRFSPGDEYDEYWYPVSAVDRIETSYNYAVLSIGPGQVVEVEIPPGLRVKTGMTVKIAAKTRQILDTVDFRVTGPIATVETILTRFTALVNLDGTSLLVRRGQMEDLEVGDRVVLDGSGAVIMTNLGPAENKLAFEGETNVSWEDIGGLAEAKAQLRAAIELPFLRPDLMAAYNQRPPKGILLFGPPRCGKTMAGKAIATSMAALHGHGASRGFAYVKAPELLSLYVGETERAIRALFAWGRQFKSKYGYPAVLFFDEADALMYKRGTGVSSDIDRTVVTTFLTEMDGLEESGVIVILATNRPDTLDPAIVGDGRVDRKIEVGRPDRAGVVDIFRLNLATAPIADGFTLDDLVQAGTDALLSPEHVLYELKMEVGALPFTLGNIVSGGMVAGVVSRAMEAAMQRDISTGGVSGLSPSDLIEAAAAVYRENFHLNHTDEVAAFAEQFRYDVTGISRPQV